MVGALSGISVVELAAIGPVPFAGMMLADHGARVVRVERPDGQDWAPELAQADILGRNRERLVLDLKCSEDIRRLREQLRHADALIEGFRPGVLERLGLAPDQLLADNPRLVIGRMTGWGQEGPLAQQAGHDINYIALAGALHGYGRKDGKPTPPLNAVGDYGGGGMMLAFGVLAGILSARQTGSGQVIDCAMVDGAALISAVAFGLLGAGLWTDERESNVLDGAAPYYDTYETADGRWIAIGAIEPQFYALLLDVLGLRDDPAFAYRENPRFWGAMKARLADIFMTKTREEWSTILADLDACFAPVLSLREAPRHPHNVVRQTFVEVGGVVQPAPAPRFSRTPAPPIRARA